MKKVSIEIKIVSDEKTGSASFLKLRESARMESELDAVLRKYGISQTVAVSISEIYINEQKAGVGTYGGHSEYANWFDVPFRGCTVNLTKS